MTDVLSYLIEKGVRIKHAGASNVHTSCFFCGESDGKRGRLYINVDENADIPGLFMCHLCGERGSLRKIKRHFGDPIGDDEKSGERRADVLNAAAAFYHDQLLERIEVLDHLYNQRGLTTDTISSHQLGFGGHGLYAHLVKQGFTLDEIKPTGLVYQMGANIVEFLQDRIIIPYHAAGNVVQLRGRSYLKEEKSKYVTPSGQKARMFNVDSVWVDPDQKRTEDIFIAEGEFDCLILEQLGYRAVGVPGAKSWRENWVEYFGGFRRVFLCFDPDEAGVGGAEKIKEAVGPRAKTVEIPAGDVSDYVVTQQRSFDELVKQATGGLLLTVRDAFDEWDSIQGQIGFKFGVDPLDAFIQPGILPGQLVITLAKTGVGKTISALNFMTLAALENPAAKFLFISLEQTRGDWFERARRIHAFHNLHLVPRTPAELPKFNVDLNTATMSFWGDRFAVVDKNRISEEELVACVADFEEQYGEKPALTVVDYLGYYANSYKASDRYERVSDAVMGLKAVAKDQRIAIYAPHQLNRKAGHGDEPAVDDARDSGAIEETADFIFTLWSEDSRKGVEMGDRTGYVNLRIGKSRHGGKGALVKFRLGYLSLAMLPIEGPYAQSTQLLADEIGFQNSKVPWEMAMQRHVLGERL